ncbi:MAG TPA: polysaccharide biosynthesis/export family protein [bacterium]|nr:polysaccharide biosynthesis/export family protein [bacterium]
MERIVSVTLLAFVLIVGCSHTSNYGHEVSGKELPFAPLSAENDVRDLLADSEEYRIGTGDELKIDVYNIPELSSKSLSISQFYGQVVDEKGEILYPIIKSIKVGGLTKKEAAKLLEERLKDFVKNPDVTVEIVKFQSKFYYITGASSGNGKYNITPTTTIMDALARVSPISDGSTITMANTVYLKRGEKVVPLSLTDVGRSQTDYSQARLRNGDTFFVPPASAERVYIVGEIARPGAYQITKPDYTVLDLIAEAGGVNPVTADTASLYLVRQYGGKFLYAALDYHKILGGDTGSDLRLQPGDRLVVAPTGLTSYNRIIQQLLPTFQLLEAATGTVRNAVDIHNGLK